MKAIERRVQKLERMTEKRHSGGFCVINASTDEEAEAQLAAYKEANSEPTNVLRIVWTPAPAV